MALRIRVCHTDDVKPGQRRGFAVAGVKIPIMVTNIDGSYIATTSMCPHEDVSLLGGKRKGTLIICPGHGYRFDLETGVCSHDPKLKLKRYPVTLVDGALYVDLI